MSQRFQAYEVKRGDNLGDPRFWNERLKDLDLRLHARELDADELKAAVQEFQALALARVNDTLSPILQDAIERLSSVGALFRGESDSELDIALGQTSLILTPSTRSSYVVTDYVTITNRTDGSKGMVAHVLDYERDTGLMSVDVVSKTGSGTYAEWAVMIGTAPVAVTTYSKDEIDAKIADASFKNRWIG